MNELRTSESCGLRLRSHSVHIDDRAFLSVTGVTDVGSFNESEVTLMTDAGGMTVEGNGLHITKLDLTDGQVTVEGEIIAIEYDGELPERRGSLFSRMFR
ncbi:MAG: sporulation protein YabP [Clostridia bacterium]|nr:sporulation protein YabP [Clostridia bacterium]